MSAGGDGMEVDNSNVIRMRVENVKDFNDDGQFEVKSIDGLPWKLTAFHATIGALCVQIQCEKSRECPIWECELEGEVKLINHADDSRSLTVAVNTSLDFESNWAEVHLAIWEHLFEVDGFVVEGSIVIEAKIVVQSRSEDRTLPLIDFFSPSLYSDVVLIVEGKRFHVSKQILAHASAYFKTLFYGNFRESQDTEIELNDVSADNFVTLLELIYDSVNNMSEINVEDLSRMAHLFDIPKVMIEVEKWLMYPNCLPRHKKLRIADQYALQVAKTHLVGKIENFTDVANLKDSESYQHYSSELKDEIIEKMLEIRAEEYKRSRVLG